MARTILWRRLCEASWQIDTSRPAYLLCVEHTDRQEHILEANADAAHSEEGNERLEPSVTIIFDGNIMIEMNS